MNSVSCTVCGSDGPDLAFNSHDRQYGGSGDFAVRRCRHCGTFFVSPRPSPEAMAQYYPPEYAPYGLSQGSSPSAWQRWNHQYSVSKLVRAAVRGIPRAGRALDVGCSSGDFLAALRAKGWSVQGVEVNASVAHRAREQAHLDVFAGSLAEANYASNTFDLITFWDVLEHLHEPRQALEEAARVSRSSGRLVVSLPNPDSVEARVFRECWAGWDVPRHLWLFPRTALTRLLEETGWQVQRYQCLRGRLWMLVLSLRLWLEDRRLNPKLQSGVLSVAGSLPTKALLLPYFWAVERLGLGSVMAAFAVRKE